MVFAYTIKLNSKISEIMPILLQQLEQNGWYIKYNDYSSVSAARRNHYNLETQFHLDVDLTTSMGIYVKCHVDIGRWHHTPKDDSRFRPAIERELNKIEVLRKR